MQGKAFGDAVDAFIAESKILVVGQAPPNWQSPRGEGFERLKLPLEIEGEQVGNYLILDAFPEHPTLKFSLGLMFLERVIDRLDYDLSAVHGNGFDSTLPREVRGPHWHSWELNRGRYRLVQHKFIKLPYASAFETSRQFDATFRWYCAERNIAVGAHSIEIPPRRRLL